MLRNDLRRAMTLFSRSGPLSHVVVAVSGGADSMALLHGLHGEAKARGLSLTVAHLHHGLRGADADADARFVQAEAQRLGWPCVVGRVRVAQRARTRHVSIEMAGREARYAFLVRIARRTTPAAVIATAHTADDQAETVLLRLARGAGTRGLAGIPPERHDAGVRVIRPLLEVSRGAIVAFLRRGGHSWREDASNADPAHLRNRVRHVVLPCLAQTLNPRVREALTRTAALLREEDLWLEGLSEALLQKARRPPSPDTAGGAGLDVASLEAHPVAARRRVLRRWLEREGVASAVLDAALVERVGGLLDVGRRAGRQALPGGVMVVRRRGTLCLLPSAAAVPTASELPEVVLAVPGETRLPAWGVRVVTAPGTEIHRAPPAGVGVLPARVTLSWRRLGRRRLCLRAWRPGDRLAPLGMSGSQKLQDLFVNARIPREQRARIPVLVCGDEILWIPGHRLARGWELRAPGERILQIDVFAWRPRGAHSTERR